MSRRFSSADAACAQLLGPIAPGVTEISSSVSRNELLVSLLTKAAELQSLSRESDVVIPDPSYSVGEYDKLDKDLAAQTFTRKRAKSPRAFPSRKNYSSRVNFILGDLIQQGYIYYAHPIWDEQFNPAFIVRLTPAGASLAANREELAATFPVPRSDLCFVIMSFSSDKRLADHYRFGIRAAIEEAGYECLRVDEIEHNRRITDLLLQQIESSRFIVADLTDARPNCYYELGWAHRAKKDVILTTHASTPIHFDVKDYNFIVYESASELHDRLLRRVRESIGLHAVRSTRA